ncbi:hypothetical protein [Oryzisolibacter sp. LB2S]|uniref:hypothetical protein n=1 Tax=Alicycliphilus soli TaxID=3228789 RepID=UPI0034587C00
MSQTQVIYQGERYTVRRKVGNVLELAYDTGSFFRLVHATSVTPCPALAVETAACGLPTPAAAQGRDNRAAWLSIADFLALENLRGVLRDRAAQACAGMGTSSARAQAGACLGAAQVLPHGNHGENTEC